MSNPLRRLIVTIGSPATLNGREGRRELADFYGALLGMRVINEGWLLIARESESKLVLALDNDGWSDDHPPRWPDPEYPQQLHLDLAVRDLDEVSRDVAAAGATLLKDSESFRVFADPAGHPFCLYPDVEVARTTVRRLVFDCFSPRSMATFYEGFLSASDRRIEDSMERVVVDLGDAELPDLGFQHAVFRPARYPDPDYPAQLHVDYRWTDGIESEAMARAEQLGAVRLPDLADTIAYADPASHPFCVQITV
ncbi:MAG TPA: VOC family protein [Microlunatus sp.]